MAANSGSSANSAPVNVEGSALVEPNEKFVDFTKMSESEQLAKIKEMQDAMGQTGYEAGNPNASPNNKLYVNTGKSMCINAYLNSDGKTYQSEHTDWGGLINENWVKNAITQIDSGMKPLSESVRGYRYMTLGAISKLTGLNINEKNVGKFINKLENDKAYAQKFNKILHNIDYTHKAYTSVSYLPEHGTYDNTQVRLNVIMQKGTPAIVTNNTAEHEIVGGKNSKYNFVGHRIEENYSKAAKKKIKQLVIGVYI